MTKDIVEFSVAFAVGTIAMGLSFPKKVSAIVASVIACTCFYMLYFETTDVYPDLRNFLLLMLVCSFVLLTRATWAIGAAYRKKRDPKGIR